MTEQNYLEVGAPVPKSIGRCADLYAQVRDLRRAMDKEVEAVKARETELREHIINSLSKSDDTGAAGLLYRAQITIDDVVRVKDWSTVWRWAKDNDRPDIYQKRLSEKAVTDWIAQNGKAIPGTEVVHVPNVSITKI